jgi:hypothetical protein
VCYNPRCGGKNSLNGSEELFSEKIELKIFNWQKNTHLHFLKSVEKLPAANSWVEFQLSDLSFSAFQTAVVDRVCV